MHCLPEAIPPRPLRQGIKQCKGWHLRRTRLVSVDATNASHQKGMRVIQHPASSICVHLRYLRFLRMGVRAGIPNSEF